MSAAMLLSVTDKGEASSATCTESAYFLPRKKARTTCAAQCSNSIQSEFFSENLPRLRHTISFQKNVDSLCSNLPKVNRQLVISLLESTNNSLDKTSCLLHQVEENYIEKNMSKKVSHLKRKLRDWDDHMIDENNVLKSLIQSPNISPISVPNPNWNDAMDNTIEQTLLDNSSHHKVDFSFTNQITSKLQFESPCKRLLIGSEISMKSPKQSKFSHSDKIPRLDAPLNSTYDLPFSNLDNSNLNDRSFLCMKENLAESADLYATSPNSQSQHDHTTIKKNIKLLSKVVLTQFEKINLIAQSNRNLQLENTNYKEELEILQKKLQDSYQTNRTLQYYLTLSDQHSYGYNHNNFHNFNRDVF